MIDSGPGLVSQLEAGRRNGNYRVAHLATDCRQWPRNIASIAGNPRRRMQKSDDSALRIQQTISWAAGCTPTALDFTGGSNAILRPAKHSADPPTLFAVKCISRNGHENGSQMPGMSGQRISQGLTTGSTSSEIYPQSYNQCLGKGRITTEFAVRPSGRVKGLM